MRSRRAQGSVEYLSIVGIALMLLIPATILFMNYAKSTNDEVLANKVSLIGNTLMQRSEDMFVLGSGSWTTAEVNMPETLTESAIINNSDLLIRYTSSKGTTDAVFFSYRFDINNGSDCSARCDLGLTPGINNVRVEYSNGVVHIKKVT